MDRITFIIHTYNRPHFLIRLVRYFDKVAAMRSAHVVIADGSSDADAAPFDEWLAAHPVGFDLTVRRHPGTTLMERLGLALETIDTPYVILGADDDLYFFDWIETAIAMMDAEADLGVVFGQFMTFRLEEFVPYGLDVAFDVPKLENPPIAWLEADSAEDRFTELSRHRLGLSSPGWYALQRTPLLAAIVTCGRRFHLEAMMFEKFMVVAQAASGKTRMLDQLFIARQTDPALNRSPFGHKENRGRVEALVECSLAYLAEATGLPTERAKEIIDTVLGPEIALMQKADRKRHLRAVANRFPVLRRLWSGVQRMPAINMQRDRRLPATPDVATFAREQRIVKAALASQEVTLASAGRCSR